MILKLDMDRQGLKIFKVYINDDPGFTLTYFSAWSNLVIIVLQTKSHVSVYRTTDPLVKV